MAQTPQTLSNIVDGINFSQETSCWIWARSRFRSGYGVISYYGKLKKAHRIIYELLVGEVPDNMELDHLCRNRDCVNPDHLEPVIHLENLQRSPIAPSTINGLKTHCVHGHEYTKENTYISHYQGQIFRKCRECALERKRK